MGSWRSSARPSPTRTTDDDVPRDGHALLAGASRSGDEGGSAMSTTKTPLSEIISVADLAWRERQPGVRMKSIWEHPRSEEHTSELQSHSDLVCRLLLEKKNGV